MVTEGPTKSVEVLKQLQDSYADLLRIQNHEIVTKPRVRLQVLRTRLENILELLNCWQQYIDAIYMSEIETQFMEVVAKDENASTSRLSYKQRQEETDVSEKLNLLFGHHENAKKPNAETTAPYETVDEGLTSDTTTDV